MKKVGILYDNISGNTGDVAIGLSLKKILRELTIAFDELFPGNFNPLDYETILIGGGYLLRQSPDFFYDKFRVPGNHILNAIGIYGEPKDLDYLREYKKITVRSNGDKKKLAYLDAHIDVVPCTTMLLEDVSSLPVTVQKPSLGIHIFPVFSEEEETQFIQWITSLPFTVYFVPITHYNKDIQYMRYLKEKIPNSEVLPILKAQEIFTLCGKFDFFISCSLHGAIFSYVHNVPFTLLDAADKMKFFMEDRQLDRYLFKNFQELRQGFEEIMSHPPDYSQKILEDKKILAGYVQYLSSVLPAAPSQPSKTIESSSEIVFQITHLLADNSELERQNAHYNHEISNLIRHTHNLESIVADRDNQITEKTQHLRNLETLLSDRDNQITEKIQHLHNLETVLADMDARFAEQEQHLRSLETMVANRDNQITENTHLLHSLEAVVAERDTRIREQEHHLHSLKTTVADRDDQVKELKHHAHNLETIVTARDTQIKELKHHAHNLETLVTTKKQQLQKVIGINQALSRENTAIKQSLTYNLTTKFHKKIVERLLPKNTRRRKYYDLGLSGSRILINEGWDRLLLSYHERKHPRAVSTVRSIPQKQPKKKVPEPDIHPVIQTKVSVIIPTKNAGADFGSVLEKIRNQKGIGTIEIIIVDSGSADHTRDTAKKAGCRVFEIRPEEFNHGLTRNYGADQASGDYIVFLVQDAIPIGEYWLYHMVKFFGEDKKIAAVTCRQVPRSDADLFAGFILWFHNRSLKRTHTMMYSCTDFDTLTPLDKRIAAGIEDTCCMMQREIFNRFRFRNIPYGEDLDIGIRLLKSGNKTAYLFTTGVIHSHNRDPFYFFKRSFIDTQVVDSLLNGPQKPADTPVSLKDLMEQILGLYALLRQSTPVNGDLSVFGSRVIDQVKKALQSPETLPENQRFFFADGRLAGIDSTNMLEVLLADCAGLVHADSCKREDSLIRRYCTLLENFSHYCEAYSSLEGRESELSASCDKLFALVAGSMLGTYYCHRSPGGLSETESALRKKLEDGV